MKPIVILSIIIIWTFEACKPVKVLKPENIKTLPASFDGYKDSSNIGELMYQEMFRDRYLKTLIDSALRNNNDLMIALQRINLSKSDVLLQKGLMKPFVGGGLWVNKRKFGLYTMDGAGNITTPIYNGKIVPIHLSDYNPGFQAAWEVDVWGKLKNKKRASIMRLLASNEGKNVVMSNLICEISNRYYELLALDYAIKVVDENIGVQENLLEMVREQKMAGRANELAVQQFEAQLLNSKGARQELQFNLIDVESNIRQLSGRYELTIDRDSADFFKLNLDSVKYGIPSDLLRNRPDIRQAEYELLASNADLKAAKAAFYPTFNITGTAGFQAFRTDLLFVSPESFVYGLFGNLVAPLLNKSAIKANFNGANALQLEAMYAYQKTVLEAYVEVYNIVSGIKNLDVQYHLKNREMNVLSSAVETSSELYKNGRATYLEVLFAQQSLIQCKLDLVEIKKLQLYSMSNLYKALGGGWR